MEILLELNSRLHGINSAIDRLEKSRQKAALLNRGLGKLNKGMGALDRGAKRAGVGIAALGVVAAGAALAGIVQAVKVYAEYEATMNGVKAVLSPTTKELKALEKETKRLGRTTKFSAREAAQGVEILAKNGVKTEAILGGVLEAALNLSASTGSELPDAADTLTDALAVFKLEASDAADVVDKINAVTINSKFGFEDFKDALAAGGASAVIAGQDFSQFTSSISATASFFDSGTSAGTAYKVFMDRLVKSTTAAKAGQKALGLELFTTGGDLKDFADIAGQLEKGMKGLTEQQRIKALTDLFGTRGKNFAAALASAGKEGIKTAIFLQQFADATDQANKRLEGTQGAVTKFKSAFEGLQITVGEPLADNITPFIEAATTSISNFINTSGGAENAVNEMFASGINGAAFMVDAVKLIAKGFALVAIQAATTAKQFKELSLLLAFNDDDLIRISADIDGLESTISSLKEMESSLDRIGGGEEFKAAAAAIQTRAGEIKTANDELRDAEAVFINLQKSLNESQLTRTDDVKGNDASAAEIEALKKQITAQAEIVEARKKSLESAKALNDGVTASDDKVSRSSETARDRRIKANQEIQEANIKALRSLIDNHSQVKDSNDSLVDSSNKSAQGTVAAIARMDTQASGHLTNLNRSLDEVQKKLQQTTVVGEQFQNDATENSWLKDTALKGIAFMQALVDEGLEPLGDKLEDVTNKGGEFENIANVGGASFGSLATLGNNEDEGGQFGSGVSSLVSSFLSPEDQIAEEYAQARAQVLAEDRLTEEQRTALMTELTNQREDALAQIESSKTQAKLQMAGDFFGNMSSLMQSGNRKLFLIGKAAAIADATIQGVLSVQKALASVPPPFNVPVAVGAGVASAVNIAKIASQQPPGFFTGGVIGGENAKPATRDNRLIRAADGERVIRNGPAQKHSALLAAINAGKDPASLIGTSLPDLRAGGVESSGVDVNVVSAAPTVNAGGANVNVLNSIDPSDIFDKMEQNGMLDDWLENRMSDPGFSTRI